MDGTVKQNLKSKLQIRQIRYFSEEFKRAKVEELDKNLISIHQIVSLYGVSRTAVYKWIYKYSPHHQQGTRQVIEMESEATKTIKLQQQVADLERIVGQKQIEIDFFKKLIEVASEDLGVDIKKNFTTQPLSGSGKTEPALSLR